MTLYCILKHHDQTGLPALGGVCETCMRENPEEIACKDLDCQLAGEQHFHPPTTGAFIDETGKVW